MGHFKNESISNHNMPYDPKLKEAMAEIKAICDKHDVGGFITLVSQTHSEFRLELAPSWSGLKWEEEGIRFRVKAKELGKEVARKVAGETCHLVYQLRDRCAQTFMHMDKLTKQIEEHLNVDHKIEGPYEHHDN